ncbi:oxidoreductase [Spirochaetia bacterium 38H-sp]|uniref:Oxidoreductase n=1 Tax=Rarispira pelagica TaxID=3141764 RepID=A0ABU9UDN0_9SPIR
METVLVTGASSGIGRATAIFLAKKGYRVYAGARRTEKMEELKQYAINPVKLDVTDEELAKSCIEKIERESGGVDILINNAGYGLYGTIEEVPIKEAKRQMDVNVFGLARMTQLVIPYMRKKKRGKIINISSIAGKLTTPLGGWYHASKFAVEALSDCLRVELSPFGIDVVVIEPGGIKTEWSDIAFDNLRKTSGSGPYADYVEKVIAMFEKNYSSARISGPEIIAETIYKAMKAKRPKTRYAAGYMARPMLLIRKLFSDRMMDRLTRLMTG